MTDMVRERDRHVTKTKKTKVTVTATPLAAEPWVSFAMSADYIDKGGKQDGESLSSTRAPANSTSLSTLTTRPN